MSVKAIFFDFDGVIKDSFDIKSEAFYELYLPFGEAIAKLVLKHHLENGGVSRFDKIKYYHQTFLNQNLTPSEVEAWANEFSRLVLQKVITSSYVPGALEAIKWGHINYLQFIVTGTPQKEIEFISQELGIKHFFVGIYGSPSGKIEISERILKQYSLKPHEVLFVGDALTDYNCAQHFGFHFLLREHKENQLLFSDVKVLKLPDLKGLPAVIEKF